MYIPDDNWYDENYDKGKMFVKNHSYVRRREELDTPEYRKNVTRFYTVSFSIKSTWVGTSSEYF